MNILALVALIQAGVVVSQVGNGNGNGNGHGFGNGNGNGNGNWNGFGNGNPNGNGNAHGFGNGNGNQKGDKWNDINPTDGVAFTISSEEFRSTLPPVQQPPVAQSQAVQHPTAPHPVEQSLAAPPPVAQAPAAPHPDEQSPAVPHPVAQAPAAPPPFEQTTVKPTSVPNATLSNGENENNGILNGHKSNGFEETKAPQVSVENLVPFPKAQNGVEKGLPAASIANQSSPNYDPSSNVTIGIVVGSILGILALVFGILVFKRRKSRNTDSICSDATIDISIPTAVFMNEPDHSASDKIAVTDKQFVENIDILSTDTLNGQDQLSSPSSPSCNSSVFEASIADGRVSIPDGRESFFPENFRETRVSQESYGSKRLSTRFDTIYIEDMTDD